MKEVFKIGEEEIEVDGLKVTDLKTGNNYAGCTCSCTGDRNRYDKEAETIVCKHFTSCLAGILRKAEPHVIQDMKEYAKVIMKV